MHESSIWKNIQKKGSDSAQNLSSLSHPQPHFRQTEGEREFVAIAIVTSNGGTPCGACRQVLAEFGLDTVVPVADAEGKLKQEASLAELLPGAFGPGDLGK